MWHELPFLEIFMESVNRGIWSAMVNKFTIPNHVVGNETVEKPCESCFQEEIWKGEYDSKKMNIINSLLNSNEFFRVFVCITAKEMWDLIQGTLKVRRAWKNFLIQEYETFRMKQGETIKYMQKRFTHIEIPEKH